MLVLEAEAVGITTARFDPDPDPGPDPDSSGRSRMQRQLSATVVKRSIKRQRAGSAIRIRQPTP
jgi:hypothetical protein